LWDILGRIMGVVYFPHLNVNGLGLRCVDDCVDVIRYDFIAYALEMDRVISPDAGRVGIDIELLGRDKIDS
jgi:hypothetical protein